MDELLLGLDIGTSSSKAVLARPDGTVVDAVEKAHSVSLPQPGWVEHDADSVLSLIHIYCVRSLGGSASQ